MKNESASDHIRQLLRKNRINRALECFLELQIDRHVESRLIEISARHSRTETDYTRGMITTEVSTVNRSGIIRSILLLLDDWETRQPEDRSVRGVVDAWPANILQVVHLTPQLEDGQELKVPGRQGVDFHLKIFRISRGQSRRVPVANRLSLQGNRTFGVCLYENDTFDFSSYMTYQGQLRRQISRINDRWSIVKHGCGASFSLPLYDDDGVVFCCDDKNLDSVVVLTYTLAEKPYHHLFLTQKVTSK